MPEAAVDAGVVRAQLSFAELGQHQSHLADPLALEKGMACHRMPLYSVQWAYTTLLGIYGRTMAVLMSAYLVKTRRRMTGGLYHSCD